MRFISCLQTLRRFDKFDGYIGTLSVSFRLCPRAPLHATKTVSSLSESAVFPLLFQKETQSAAYDFPFSVRLDFDQGSNNACCQPCCPSRIAFPQGWQPVSRKWRAFYLTAPTRLLHELRQSSTMIPVTKFKMFCSPHLVGMPNSSSKFAAVGRNCAVHKVFHELFRVHQRRYYRSKRESVGMRQNTQRDMAQTKWKWLWAIAHFYYYSDVYGVLEQCCIWALKTLANITVVGVKSAEKTNLQFWWI